MFSYVAKSLLSKTLRTFLRKYLENIELESIDYGSTTNTNNNSNPSNNASSSSSSSSSSGGGGGGGGNTTNNASGSGWGVSLSNVKLREGMELVKLKGKRKRVVKRMVRKRAKKKKNGVNRSSKENINASPAAPADIDATPVIKNSRRKVVGSEGGGDASSSGFPPLPDIDVGEGGSDAAPDGPPLNNGEHGYGAVVHPEKTVTLPLHEKIQNRDRSLTADSADIGYFSSNPSTPTQSRHGLCGVPSPFCTGGVNSRRGSVESFGGDQVVGNGDLLGDGVDYSQLEAAVSKVPSLPLGVGQLGKGELLFADGKGISCNEHSDENIDRESSLDDQSNMAGDFITPAQSTEDSNNEDGEEDSFEFIEVEEEVIVEDDMVLVVGAGGVIGTLNIRLVGKELHVTVEDAHLIIEAVSDEDAETNKPRNDGTTKTPPKSNLRRSPSASSTADLTSLVTEDEGGQTIGEKIKKKSMIARYLSKIPHLFLRDCRVSFIMPEEMGDDSASTQDNCDDCTVFELGIDFLSVSSGDDFMDMLKFDHNQPSEEATKPKPNPFSFRRSTTVPTKMPSSNSEEKRLANAKNQNTPNNIFQRKRIRTGKGPDAGIWLKIHPPHQNMTLPSRARHPSGPKWARQRFLDSSESFFFRVSGVDLHARMLVDVKKDKVDEISNVWGNEYEDYTMDSMLFGVDYVDPVSLTRHQIQKENMRLEQMRKSEADELSDVASGTDSNGIQSIPFASNLHWMAQRAHRSDCPNKHLPLNDCFFCWDKCVQQSSPSSMNNQMPLPGFVFCLSMTDPLEVNVDHSSLEALGYLKSLFTPNKPVAEKQEENAQHEKDEYANGMKSNPGQDDEGPSSSGIVSPCAFYDKSFPSFMTPDAIYLSGIHLSKLIVRVEAINPSINNGLKFRFWQFIGQSIHLEHTQVDSEEQRMRDLTFYVGRVEVKDLAGVCERNLVVAGTDLEIEPSSSENMALLPCTASRVLGVSTEQLYKPYATHLRLVQYDAEQEVIAVPPTKVNYLDIQVGVFDVDVDDTLPREILKTYGEVSSMIFRKPRKAKTSNTKSKPKQKQTSKWLFHISTKGGTFSYNPRIQTQVPESQIQLRKGSEGLSFETFLHGLEVKYGSYNFEQPVPPSIRNLCALPETLRMHILLYLDDLTPLERVLNIRKKKQSTFLRSHAINKKLTQQLVKLGGSSAKEKGCSEATRRINALSRLQSLDVESLEALLAINDKLQTRK